MSITMDTLVRCTTQLCSMTECEFVVGTDIQVGSAIRYSHKACDGGRITAYTQDDTCLYEYYRAAIAGGTDSELGGGFTVTSECQKVVAGSTVVAYCDTYKTVSDIIAESEDLGMLVDTLKRTELTDGDTQCVINFYFESKRVASEEDLTESLNNKADLIDGVLPMEQLPGSFGQIYTKYATSKIEVAGIDTMTDGASITIPKGTYIIMGYASITAGVSSGTRNIQIRLLAGSTSLGIQRVFVAAANYGSLHVSAIYNATAETKITVQKSSSIPENDYSGSTITAIRLK